MLSLWISSEIDSVDKIVFPVKMLEYLAKSCVSYYQTNETRIKHYDDVIMDTIASQITSLTIVYSIVYSGTDHRNHQSSASLAFVRGIHRGPVNFPHRGPVTRKIFPFDDVIMTYDRVMVIVPNHTDTETEMLSFWWNFNHWLHRKLSFWQLSVQPVIKISSKWRHFCFSGYDRYYYEIVNVHHHMWKHMKICQGGNIELV